MKPLTPAERQYRCYWKDVEASREKRRERQNSYNKADQARARASDMINVTTNFKGQKRRAKARRDGNSPTYLSYIRRLPSCVSWQYPCEPHHLLSGPAALERGIGMKATDRWALPLTAGEHRFGNDAVHNHGSREELNWFVRHGLPRPYALCEALWAARDDFEAMYRVLLEELHARRL